MNENSRENKKKVLSLTVSRNKTNPQINLKKNISDFLDLNRETEVSETPEIQYHYRPVERVPTVGELLSVGYKLFFFFELMKKCKKGSTPIIYFPAQYKYRKKISV